MTGLQRYVDISGGSLSLLFGTILCGGAVLGFSVGLAMIWSAILYGK